MKKIFGRIKIIPAKEAHIKYLADNMREEDKREVMAASGDGPLEALNKSFSTAKYCFTAFYEGAPLCMFGINPQGFISNRACLWLLGTDKVKKCPKDFCRATLYFVNAFLKEYDILFNFVDARYESSINWLIFAGAEFNESKPYGKEKLPFKYFEIRRT
ncbi:hypothetical protein Dip510_000827 [Elusimicrobium posterum]|uniref:hypothetical protein n=1 Tax=Elusimicrobium posterum TaxID=3116653 RepID=UPI003C72D70A